MNIAKGNSLNRIASVDVNLNNYSICNNSDSRVSFNNLSNISNVQHIVDVASRLFPGTPLVQSLVLELLSRCDELVATIFDIEDAVVWSDNFVFPSTVYSRDFEDLTKVGFDLTKLVRTRQEECPHTRLSLDSIHLSGGDFSKDGALLREMAELGVAVMTGPLLVPNRVPPSFSPAYSVASSAVNKLIYDSYLSGMGLLLPTSCLDGVVAPGRLHFSRVGLTLKKGTKSGRVTSNYSYSTLGHSIGSLNSEEVVDMAREKYGPIELATVFELVAMVVTIMGLAIAKGLRALDVVLWSMDLKGAFTLLWFTPEDVALLALPLSDGLSFLPIAGNFGLGMFPFVFNVVSRFIQTRAKDLLRGLTLVYVDDIQGCCFRQDLEHDLEKMHSIITDLLGSDSVADHKTVFGRQIDWIGWSFDLDSSRVSIADKNYFKTLHGFLSVRQGQDIQVRTLHTLASWASRYSLICPVLKPFAGYLYDAFAGYTHLDSYIPLPTEAYLVIVLWRLFLIMMKMDPMRHTRDLHSFASKGSATFMIESDGCPGGLGFFLHRRSSSSDVWEEFYAVSLVGEYDLGNDSRYQNAMEFIGILMGLVTLRWMGVSHAVVDVLGDNTSSLSWIDDWKFRTGSSTSAALLFVLVCHTGMLSIGESVFRAGVDNRADGLSRGDPVEAWGYLPTLDESFSSATIPPGIDRLSCLVDPSVNVMTEDTLINTWVAMMEVLSQFPAPVCSFPYPPPS